MSNRAALLANRAALATALLAGGAWLAFAFLAPARERRPAAPPPPAAASGCLPGMARVAGGRVDTLWEAPVFGPGRPLIMAATARDEDRAAKPPREVADFCIDRFEYPNQRNMLPRVRVGFEEAASLCRAAGKRLCREDEWELACAGGERRRFPYGSRREAWRCHADGVTMGDEQGVAAAGTHPGCATPEGVYDLDGNVSEWVDAEGPEPAGWGVLRGSTMWPALYGQDCYSRHLHAKGQADFPDDGFRCCADVANPATAPLR